MKPEPDIDKAALADTIRRQYGISIESLAFVPKGFASHCYVARARDGARYFLKLPREAPMAASSPEFYVPLTYNLYHKGLYTSLAYPIRALDGGLSARFGSSPLILFNYVEGRTLDDEDLLSDALLPLTAEALGAIHRSTPHIDIEEPFTERFQVAFRDALLDGLAQLEGVAERDNPGKRALADLLLPRAGELLRLLDRLEELRQQAMAVHGEMVVCHTDLHGGNAMLDGRGELHVLDWENAMVAPPEHDLFAFAGHPSFAAFLERYERAHRPVALHAHVFGFYMYRRNLEDLADWVLRILFGKLGDDQDTIDLQGVEESIAHWSGLEPELDTAARTLDSRHPR